MPAKTATRGAAGTASAKPPTQARKNGRRAVTAPPPVTFAAAGEPEPEVAATVDETAAPPRRLVDGQEVVAVDPEESPLSKHWGKFIPIHGRRILTLADGSKVFGCADCPETGTRGDIIRHRVEQHGAAKPGANRPAGRKEAPALDLSWLNITIGEVVDLAQHVGGFETELDRIRDERDEERAGRLAAERELKQIKRALEKVGFVVKVEESE